MAEHDLVSRFGQWASAQTLAKAIGYHDETLLGWRRRGIVRGLRIGPRRLLLSVEDIAAQIRPALGPAADGAGEGPRP